MSQGKDEDQDNKRMLALLLEGESVACIDNVGDVHPDQFWRRLTVGNVLDRPFSEIWSDEDNEMLRKLRNRAGLVGGRCATCAHFGICNGNLRPSSDIGNSQQRPPIIRISISQIRRDIRVRCFDSLKII